MKFLSKIGAFFTLAGIASIVLYFMGYNLSILMWIDNWGMGPGWMIRIACIVVGLVLVVVGMIGGKKSG